MIPHSIRWRLPLSYAAIALLAALSLGLVLITTLRSYYQQRELAYLNSNAAEFSQLIGYLLANDTSTETLQSQIQGLAFLAQVRVRLIDASGRVLNDSGAPDRTNVAFGTVRVAPIAGATFEMPLAAPPADVITFISVGDALPAAGSVVSFTELITPPFTLPLSMTAGIRYTPRLSVIGTPLGFNVSAETPAANLRSDQVVRQPVYGEAGELRGHLELSEGPAYGREIVDSVTGGWALAGSVAVMLAASAGWLVSRRISLPLMALNEVTTRMAHGDLTTRANMAQRDEFGALARSFNDMADRVEETIVALRRFVADAAHELHTPLTALRADLELASEAGPPATRNDLLNRAQEQIHRLETLTSGLLDLSQIEARDSHQEHNTLDLVALVQEMSEVHASRAEQLGVAFSLDLPQGDAIVRGQAEQLRQALGNLIDNAVKFTPEGGEVTVGLRQAADHVEVWVQDAGIGIPSGDLPQLFNRFHRGHNASAYPGNGLGLAIVKAIVERHGGQVTAENTSPGARFTIRLPAARRP
jgi:signal transduction histidine kinase